MIASAREAVQTAEDARAIAVKKIDEERQENERQAAADAQAQTQAQADDATRRTQQAQSDQAQDRVRPGSGRWTAASALMPQRPRQKLNRPGSADGQVAVRVRPGKSSAAQADADQFRLAAQQSQLTAQQAEADKAAMRTRLSEQLNSILQTRDSARGLIVNLSDVLFDTGKYSLKPGAREKLAKVAGILLAYPGLNIEVGGYTDNVGGDVMNQRLSENRAGSVRDYLVHKGWELNSVTARRVRQQSAGSLQR